jgi:hypothetical protein
VSANTKRGTLRRLSCAARIVVEFESEDFKLRQKCAKLGQVAESLSCLSPPESPRLSVLQGNRRRNRILLKIAPKAFYGFYPFANWGIPFQKFHGARKLPNNGSGSMSLLVPAHGNTCCNRVGALREITASYDQVLTSSYGLILSESGGHQYPPRLTKRFALGGRLTSWDSRKRRLGSGEMGWTASTLTCDERRHRICGRRCCDAAFT